MDKKPCALQSGVHFVRFQLAPNVSPFLLFFCNRTLLFRIGIRLFPFFTDRRPDSGSEWQEYYEVEVFGGKQFVIIILCSLVTQLGSATLAEIVRNTATTTFVVEGRRRLDLTVQELPP